MKTDQAIIDIVVGTRPNFVKAAPLVRQIDTTDGLQARLVHTGQHDQPALVEAMFRDLGLRVPDVSLNAGGGSQAEQTGRTMMALETFWNQTESQAVIVIGDVNSTLAAALTAKKAQRPLVHLEAGLRSGDRTMPEEINRLAVDAISDRLWAPSPDAFDNLRAEGKAASKIAMVGNFVADAVMFAEKTSASQIGARDQFSVPDTPYVLTTLHRPGNVDDPDRRAAILDALDVIADEIDVILIGHPRLLAHNPQRKGPKLKVKPPLSYREFLAFQRGAAIVLTDSGGVQEETSLLGVPCLTLRDNTERPLTIELGTNRLTHLDRLRADIAAHKRPSPSAPLQPAKIPGWDGKAAQLACADLLEWLGRHP